MGRPALNLANTTIGRLHVVERVPSASRAARWRALCSCGNEVVVVGSKVLAGETTASCGCLKRELLRRAATRHGCAVLGRRTPTWVSWQAMRRRCLGPKTHGYERYGGRGITICRRWDSFENFRADMGERPPGLTLDRKNNDGNYTPENCRWATWSQQLTNRGRS